MVTIRRYSGASIAAERGNLRILASGAHAPSRNDNPKRFDHRV
jgi:hypothetical protein